MHVEKEVKGGTDPLSPLRSNMLFLHNLMADIHSFSILPHMHPVGTEKMTTHLASPPLQALF